MTKDYIKVAREVIEKAEKTREQYKGNCEDCKWRRRGEFPRGPICINPVVILAQGNAEQGYDRTMIGLCDTQRSKRSPWGDVVCGPRGSLFEPVELTQRVSWWQRLFR